MDLVANPYAATLVLSALAVMALGAAAWSRRRDARGGRALALLSLSATAWALAEVAWLDAGPGDAGTLGLRLVAATGALLPPLLLGYAFAATRLLPRLRGLLPAVALGVAVLVVGLAFGPVGGLSLWTGLEPKLALGRLVVVGVPNAFGWVAASFEALMSALALVLLALAAVRTPGARRAPMAWALAGAGLPVAVEAARSLLVALPPATLPVGAARSVGAGIAPGAMVLAPAALALGQGLFGGTRYRREEGPRGTAPQLGLGTKRAELIDHLELPVLVIDGDQRVSYANAAAALLLHPRAPIDGVGVAALFPDAPELQWALMQRRATVQPFDLVRGGGARPFEAWLTPLSEATGRYAGTLLTLVDLGALRHAEAAGGLAEEEARRSTVLLEAFRDVLLGIGRGDKLGILLDVALTGAASALGAPHGALYLTDPAADALVRRTALGAFESWDEPPLRRDEGLVGRVWAASRLVAVDAFPEPREDGPDAWAGATVGVPLRAGSRTLGVLLLARRQGDPAPFAPQDLEALERFADLAALAVRDLSVRERAERADIELAWLDQLDAAIARGAPDTAVLELALTAAREAAGFDRAVAWLADDAGDTLEACAWTGFPTGPEAGLRFGLDGSVPLLEEAFRGDQEIVLQGGAPIPARFRPRGPAAASPLVRGVRPAVLPLRGATAVLGVLMADDGQEGVDLAARLRALRRIAVRAGQALDRARAIEREARQNDLVDRTEDLLDAVLEAREGLIEALDAGYFETDLRGNLTRLSPEMARLAGADERDLVGVRLPDLAPPGAEQALIDLMGRVLRSARPVRRASWALSVPRTGQVAVELTLGLLRDEDGEPSGYFGLLTARAR